MSARRIAVPAAVLVAGLASAGGTPVLEEALHAKSWTGADGVVVLSEKHVRAGSDGRVVTRIHEVQRFLTDMALDEYGDPWIPFNAAHQDVHVAVARTMRQDGQVVDATPNALNEVTPESVSAAPWYADVQDMIVTLLGLELGSASEVDLSVEDKEPFRKLLYGSEPLRDGRDAIRREISISIPSDDELLWHAEGSKVEPEVTKADGMTEYRFVIENADGVSQAEASGPGRGLSPVLYWMEGTSTKKLAGRLLSSAPYALGKDGAGEADAIIDVLEAELGEESCNGTERALGYYRRIVDDVAGVDVDRAVFGDRARKPSRAFLSGYADGIEKLGILHTVFERLGHDPVPLVVLAHDPGGPLRLHPHNVEELWIRIAVEGRYLYLNAAGSAGAGEPRGEHVYVLSKDGIEPATFVKPATTRMRFDALVDLTADTPVVKGTASLRGAFNPYWTLFLEGGGDPASSIEELLGPEAGIEVTKASFKRLALDESIVAFEGTPVILDGILDVTIPSLVRGLVEAWEIWRPGRDLPIRIESASWEKVRVEVRLPDGAEVLYSPAIDETARASGPISIFHSKGLDAKHVALARRIALDAGTILPGDVDGAREIVADALSRNRNRIVVKLAGK
jgi:hypothetical protein